MNSVPRLVRFFTAILILSCALLALLLVDDYHTNRMIKDLKEQYSQITQLKVEFIHIDEVLSSSARMAAATSDTKWDQRYHTFELKFSGILQQATMLDPKIYRKEIDRTNPKMNFLSQMEHKAFDLIHQGHSDEALSMLLSVLYEKQKTQYVRSIQQLNEFLEKQTEATLVVQGRKIDLSRVFLMTVLILLLLSWLIILRATRHYQEALLDANRRLTQRTQELDDLNHTLEQKINERTNTLSNALEELKKVQTQLLQSEKFTAIGQLAAGVAHEINNPIGVINSNLQTLEKYLIHYSHLSGLLNKLDQALKDKDQHKVLENINAWEKMKEESNFEFIDSDIGNLLKESKEGAEKIWKIILDMRAFTSADKGMMSSVNVEALMDSVLNIISNELKYKTDIKKEYGQVPAIVCNPQKISQVFVNLLMNAVQSIETKGTVTIRTYIENNHVGIDISDTGRGISPEDVTKIFDPFFTTKPVWAGVGLGLSVSYDIVRKHGGAMTFSSQLGQGTTFTVMLPES